MNKEVSKSIFINGCLIHFTRLKKCNESNYVSYYIYLNECLVGNIPLEFTLKYSFTSELKSLKLVYFELVEVGGE